jgi:hypothetical protein
MSIPIEKIRFYVDEDEFGNEFWYITNDELKEDTIEVSH